MSLLAELKNAQTFDGKHRRRWFSSTDMDLIVWYDEDDTPAGFELYYDKNIREHVFIWRKEKGFAHLAVDDGEQKTALNYKETPILIPDGHMDSNRIKRLFEASCDGLPDEVVSLVKVKLMSHPAFQPLRDECTS